GPHAGSCAPAERPLPPMQRLCGHRPRAPSEVDMLVACWSAKGGSGTTVVASSLALLLAQRDPLGSLLVDVAGDVPLALGLAEPTGPGLAGWLAAGPDVPADGLHRIEAPAEHGLAVLPRGDGPLDP